MAEGQGGISDRFKGFWSGIIKSKSPEAQDYGMQAVEALPSNLHKGKPMPGEEAEELHPDDAAAMAERKAEEKRRLDFAADVVSSGISFNSVEPPGGYDTTHQPGDTKPPQEIKKAS